MLLNYRYILYIIHKGSANHINGYKITVGINNIMILDSRIKIVLHYYTIHMYTISKESNQDSNVIPNYIDKNGRSLDNTYI